MHKVELVTVLAGERDVVSIKTGPSRGTKARH